MSAYEKDEQKCSQRVLGLVCYKIYMLLIFKPSKQYHSYFCLYMICNL
jgi:hypothetical protein